MLVPGETRWDKTADVVVIGYGMAGAVGAITAHDAGAKVIIVEKMPADNHYSFSSMSAGVFLCPTDVKGAVAYLNALCRVGSENLYWTDPEINEVWARYAVENKEYVESLGGKVRLLKKGGEHPELPGSESMVAWAYRGLGLRMMEFLYDCVKSRGIEVLYGAPAQDLITSLKGEVVGVKADTGKGKTINIKASRGVLLACGGFEFNEQMKLNYLKVYPSWFTGSPANTGDGIKMALKVGADLWHMNCVSATLVAKFPDFPIPFSMDYGGAGWTRRQIHGPDARELAGFIIVDRYGRRFTRENMKRHCTYYELASFDTHRLEHPRAPSYYVFDRRRFEDGPLTRRNSGPAGAHRLYRWSRDNSEELQKGWIIKAETPRELARKLGMSASVLESTIRSWNKACEAGNDAKFGRNPIDLVPLDNPPFYAVELSPGGPNTQGGPRRNKRAQIVDPDGQPIPGLYGAGELGSIFGMLYPQSGGNLAECIAFGRVAGGNAAREKAGQ